MVIEIWSSPKKTLYDSADSFSAACHNGRSADTSEYDQFHNHQKSFSLPPNQGRNVIQMFLQGHSEPDYIAIHCNLGLRILLIADLKKYKK